jgi:hypothetical protein
MESVRTSETSDCFYETTRHYIPAGCNPHTCCREDLKSQLRLNFIGFLKDGSSYEKTDKQQNDLMKV